MENEEVRRRKAAVAILTAKYLRYVEEHESDEGFSTEGLGTLQQIRQALLDAHLIVRTSDALELTAQGQAALQGARSVGF